jgi:hypothetical protein
MSNQIIDNALGGFEERGVASNSEREAFEKAMREDRADTNFETHPGFESNPIIYRDPEVQAAWFGWQAATSHLMPAMKEARDALAEQYHRVENLLIADGMGWDMEGVTEDLAKTGPATAKALATLNAICKE